MTHILREKLRVSPEREHTLSSIFNSIEQSPYFKRERKSLGGSFIWCFYDIVKSDPLQAVWLAYDYGRSVGYRAAKKRR